MINANDFGNIMNDVKIEKFNRMVKHQEKIIKENMKQGYNSVLWIFSDKEQYTTPNEKEWYQEFYNEAKTGFQNQGFKIDGIFIKW